MTKPKRKITKFKRFNIILFYPTGKTNTIFTRQDGFPTKGILENQIQIKKMFRPKGDGTKSKTKHSDNVLIFQKIKAYQQSSAALGSIVRIAVPFSLAAKYSPFSKQA